MRAGNPKTTKGENMGGYGSGRSGRRQKAEDMLCLSVHEVHRRGFLKPGASCLWTWTWTSGDKSSISLQALAGALRLHFKVRADGEDWQDVAQVVGLEHTPCHYGGSRPWFRCPRCGRRVAKLFGGVLFLCRKCHGLAYRSQAETYSDRCFRRANKLRERLGGEPGVDQYMPKPKWMRWATFEGITHEVRELENAGLMAAVARYPSLRDMVWPIMENKTPASENRKRGV